MVLFLGAPFGALHSSGKREQVCTWIPKTESIRSADMRELGLSTAFYRLINRVLRQVTMSTVAKRMHKSLMLLYSTMDILEAVDYAQSYLDRTLPSHIMSDIAVTPKLLATQALALIGCKPVGDDVPELRLQNLADYFVSLPSEIAMTIWTNIGQAKVAENITGFHGAETSDGCKVNMHIVKLMQGK